MKNVDPEEHHERDEVDIEALIRRIEAEEESNKRAAQGNEPGTPSRPRSSTRSGERRLGRLTETKNKSGEVTSVLAFDDITNMRLDAGKVIEARTKTSSTFELSTLGNTYPAVKSGRSSRQDGSILIKAMMSILFTSVG